MDTSIQTSTPVKETPVEKPSAFEGIDMSPERHENELYCDYRCRKWWMARLIKFYLKGRPIWQAHQGIRHGSFTTV